MDTQSLKTFEYNNITLCATVKTNNRGNFMALINIIYHSRSAQRELTTNFTVQ